MELVSDIDYGSISRSRKKEERTEEKEKDLTSLHQSLLHPSHSLDVPPQLRKMGRSGR